MTWSGRTAVRPARSISSYDAPSRAASSIASQTIATQSYQLSFVEFDFGQGAALGNVLIVISLVFAILYLRATRRNLQA